MISENNNPTGQKENADLTNDHCRVVESILWFSKWEPLV